MMDCELVPTFRSLVVSITLLLEVFLAEHWQSNDLTGFYQLG